MLNVSANKVSTQYFDTMGIRLLAGRLFTANDAPQLNRGPRRSFESLYVGPLNVIVNAAFVRRFFPNQDPVGKRFGTGVPIIVDEDEIIGVVSDAKYRSMREPIIPIYYTLGVNYGSFVLNVRTRPRPESIFEPVRKALASIDRGLAFTEIHTLAEEVDYSTAGERVTAVLASGFGAIAALLAGVGIYGLLAYAVAQRRREIGIRMALGASGLDIVNTVGRHALSMTVVGISLGLGSMLLAGRWIRSLLYGVSADDPSSLSMAAVFVAFVAVAAMVTPLTRAIRIEPAIALRQEN